MPQPAALRNSLLEMHFPCNGARCDKKFKIANERETKKYGKVNRKGRGRDVKRNRD